jgi:MFS family permease
MGGAAASSSGPVLGGLLTLISWRAIFFVNVPVGAVALVLLTHAARSPQRRAPFDWIGQATAILAMGGITYGAIEAGAEGFFAPHVVGAFLVAVVAFAVFLIAQARGAHPMLPLDLFQSRTVSIASGIGFAFIVGYYGLPFVMSLYLQQVRGLSPLATGAVFLPMMLIGAVLTPFSARAAERVGARTLITAGLVLMVVGLALLAFLPPSAPVWALSAGMLVVGVAGPLTMPPVMGALLNSVPEYRAGTASGVFNTSRQIGGALAIAVFGALLADQATFMEGLQTSLLIAALVALAAAAISLLLPARRQSASP